MGHSPRRRLTGGLERSAGLSRAKCDERIIPDFQKSGMTLLALLRCPRATTDRRRQALKAAGLRHARGIAELYNSAILPRKGTGT